MSVFNEEKYNDIQELKKLRRRKDKSAYQDRKKEIAKKWKVTGRAVEIWLTQRLPGMRKSRSDSGKARNKVTPKEKAIAKELITSGKSKKETGNILSLTTGKKVSTRKLNRITDEIDGELDSQEIQPSNFGDSLRDFIKGFFEVDLIPPGYGVEIKIADPAHPSKKIKYIVPVEDCEDICLVLANSYNRVSSETFKVDREQLRRRMIEHLVEQQVRMAKLGAVDTKTVKELVKMQKDLTVRLDIDVDIKLVEKICKELKKDITFDEIYQLLKKYSNVE